MARIKPFKGVRPPRELVEQVESRPYDVLESDEARIEAGDNEKSLYHIIKPEINFEPGTSEYDPKVYEEAAHQFQMFQDKAGLYRISKSVIISMHRHHVCLQIMAWRRHSMVLSSVPIKTTISQAL